MAITAGRSLIAADLTFPAVVTASSSTNTITATSWAVLPDNPVSASITNPHPTATMLTAVTYGAKIVAVTNECRASLDISGAVTIAPGVGGGFAESWGEILWQGASNDSVLSVTATVELPPGSTTFSMHAYRTTSGTQTVNYPTIRLVPIRYLF